MNDHTSTTVGIDICKAHLDVHELPSGRSGRFANDAAGFVELADWIPPDIARVVYESTGPWHRALEEALAENLPLARVNALRARRFAQAVGQQAKTDAVDARMLATMGAAVQTRLVELPSATQRDLDELQTARDALTKSRIAVLNRRHIARHPLVKRQLRYRLTQIDNQLKAIDAAIRKLVKADEALARKAAVLTSIPGVAAITAAGLLAGMPELGRLDAKAVSSLAGLAPVARESGQWKGRRFIGGGRGRGAQAPLHGRPERRPAQSGTGRCLPPPPRTRQAGQGRADRRHAQADRARQHVAEGRPRVDAGLKPERRNMTVSRRTQSPARGPGGTSVTTRDTLPQPAPHRRRHASRCTRYVGVLRTGRHSGCARFPNVHAHICTHYPVSPIIYGTTCQLRPERQRWTARS